MMNDTIQKIAPGTLALVLLLACIAPRIADGDETSPEVVSQDAGDTFCGPCAVLNAFRFGDAALTNLAAQLPGHKPPDKVKNLVATYGNRDSSLFYHKPRYTRENGIWDEDMAPFINDVFKDHGVPMTVSGEYLALRAGETAQDHLTRVHDLMESSIEAGFPPVLGLHSYIARKKIIHYRWYDWNAHFVTVIRVQPLARGAPGFSMWVADSNTGRILQTFVYAERHRDFSAITAVHVNKHHTEQDTWASGHPYLLIISPELEDILDTDSARWHERTICALEYLIYK